jgi:transposase
VIYANELTPEEATTLNEMHKNHPLHMSRKRAHSILLSHQGMSVPLICSIYLVSRQTVSTWFTKWETLGICGLVDNSGRGRPSLLSDQQKKCCDKSSEEISTIVKGSIIKLRS